MNELKKRENYYFEYDFENFNQEDFTEVYDPTGINYTIEQTIGGQKYLNVSRPGTLSQHFKLIKNFRPIKIKDVNDVSQQVLITACVNIGNYDADKIFPILMFRTIKYDIQNLVYIPTYNGNNIVSTNFWNYTALLYNKINDQTKISNWINNSSEVSPDLNYWENYSSTTYPVSTPVTNQFSSVVNANSVNPKWVWIGVYLNVYVGSLQNVTVWNDSVSDIKAIPSQWNNSDLYSPISLEFSHPFVINGVGLWFYGYSGVGIHDLQISKIAIVKNPSITVYGL